MLGAIIGAALPGVLPSITDTIGKLVDRLVPDPQAAAQAKKELEEAITAREAIVIKAIADQNAAQNALNLAEAQGNDRFSSRWRPSLGWACVAAFIYQFLAAPLLTWAGGIIGVALDIAFPAPPTLTVSDFMPVLIGMLGLGGLRTYERVSGVSTAVPQQLRQ